MSDSGNPAQDDDRLHEQWEEFWATCPDCGHSESCHGDGSGKGCYLCGCLT